MTTESGADRLHATRPTNFRLGQHLFSPIAHIETVNCGAESRQEETPDVSLLRVPSDDGEDERETLAYERSLTRFSLGDLSRRLGGTGLCYSRDSLLEITERLEEGERRKDSLSLINTAEELEKLMLSLSGN